MSPLDNPLGFSGADCIEILVAALLLACALGWRPFLEPHARRFATRAAWSMLLLAALPVVLRLLLLPNHPVPSPDVYDEFGHLLVADTLSHLRLANPAHPMHRFFETFFVLQEPTYSAIYPLGQGLVLALGRTLFGTPWAGVVLAVAAFCALCYWMLRAWTTPGWALAGGILAVIEFGPLNQWMNNYWGGAVPAAAGCLVFGALPRIAQGRLRDRLLLGLGLGIHLLTRPFESIFLVLSVGLYFLPALRHRKETARLARAGVVVALAALPALALTLAQNHQVTGHWTTLPEALSQYQYGVPSAFTFQPNVVPHRDLTREQALDYKMQLSFHGPGTDTLAAYLLRTEYRVRFYRFFFPAPLYIALLAFLPAAREYRFAWVLATLALFALGTNFFPAFQFHYIAAASCLFILASVEGLRRLAAIQASGWAAGEQAARVVVLLCLLHFAFWYTLHATENRDISRAARQYETWNTINHGGPERRIEVNRQLATLSGKVLVFVRYSPRHIFQEEWVYNAADIDAARIVWARDLGPEENQSLLRYYPDRTPVLLETDFRPPRLIPYR
jgi:hypothetical protein